MAAKPTEWSGDDERKGRREWGGWKKKVNDEEGRGEADKEEG